MPHLLEEKPLTEADKEAGVQRDLVVRLGSKSKQDDFSTACYLSFVFLYSMFEFQYCKIHLYCRLTQWMIGKSKV